MDLRPDCAGNSEDVQLLAQRLSFTPLYLLNTGDITETGMPDEFKDAYAQTEIVRTTLNIERKSVLNVLGNYYVFSPLAKVGREIGSPELKYQNFRKRILRIGVLKSRGPALGATIVDTTDTASGSLLNSCAKEDDVYHGEAVDTETLIAVLDADSARPRGVTYLKDRPPSSQNRYGVAGEDGDGRERERR